jgi:hypothetical protein
MVFLCQTTILSARDFRTRKPGGDGISCDAGAKSKTVASLRANPNQLQAAPAPQAREATGNKVRQSPDHSLRETDDYIGTSARMARDVGGVPKFT